VDDVSKVQGRTGGPFTPLLLSLLILFALVPVLPALGVRRAGLQALYTVILLAGLWAVAPHRRRRLAGAALLLPALALGWLAAATDSGGLQFAKHLLDVAALAFVTGCIVAHIYSARAVTRDTIRGAICVYALFGLAWAAAYAALAAHDPAALAGSGWTEPHAESALYFSFVTLTTLGYGDVAPVTGLARHLVILEALTGQLYLVVTISRLIGLHLATEGSSAT
jgi:hypothetical protein